MVIRAHLKAFRGFNHWHPAVVAVDYITEIHNAFMAVGKTGCGANDGSQLDWNEGGEEKQMAKQ